MNPPRSSFDSFLLFPYEPDIWSSLDESTQEKVIDCLAALLLEHLHQTARRAEEAWPLTSERLAE